MRRVILFTLVAEIVGALLPSIGFVPDLEPRHTDELIVAGLDEDLEGLPGTVDPTGPP